MKEIEKNFGEALFKLRTKLGISQDRFARILEKPVRNYARWEKEGVVPEGKTVLKILSMCPDQESLEDFGIKVPTSKKHPLASEGVVGRSIGIHGLATPGTQRKEIERMAAEAERNVKILYELGVSGLADTQHVLHCIARRLRESTERIVAAEEKKAAQARKDSERDHNSSLAPSAPRSAK